MNTPAFFRTALAVATLSAPVQDICAQTRQQTQQLVENTSFGLLVLKGQSIDPGVKIPHEFFRERNHGHLTMKEILALEMGGGGGCGGYSIVKTLTSDGKLEEGEFGAGSTKAVFDILSLERALNAEAKMEHLPTIKADGRMTQETVNLMLEVSIVNACG